MPVTKAKISVRAYTCLFFLLFTVEIICALTNREQVATFAQEVALYEQQATALYNKKNKGAIITVDDQLGGAQLKHNLLRLITSIDQYRKANAVSIGEGTQPAIVALDREAEGLRHKAFRLLMLLHRIIATTISATTSTKTGDQEPKPDSEPQEPNIQDKETPEPYQDPDSDAESEDSERDEDTEQPEPEPDEKTEANQNDSDQESDSDSESEEPGVADINDSEADADPKFEDSGPQQPAIEQDVSVSGSQEPTHDSEREHAHEPVVELDKTIDRELPLTNDQAGESETEETQDDPLTAISQLFNESPEKTSEHPEYYFLNQEVLDRVKRSGLDSNQLDRLAQKYSLDKQNVAWMISLARKAQSKVTKFGSLTNVTEFLTWLISCKQFERRQGFEFTSKDFAFYPEASRNKEWLAYFLKAIQVFGKQIGGKLLFEKLKGDKDKQSKEYIKQLYDAAKTANNGCTEVLRSFGFPEPPVTGPGGEILLTAAEQAQKNKEAIEKNKENANKAQELAQQLLLGGGSATQADIKSNLDNLLKAVSIKPAGEARADSGGAASQAGQEKQRDIFNSKLVEFKEFFLEKKDIDTLNDKDQEGFKNIFVQLVDSFSSMRASRRSETKVLKYGSTEDPRFDLSDDEYQIGYYLYVSAYMLTGKIADVSSFDEGIVKELKQALKRLYDELKDHYKKINKLEKLPAPLIIREKTRTQEEQAKIDKEKKQVEKNKENQGNLIQELKEQQDANISKALDNFIQSLQNQDADALKRFLLNENNKEKFSSLVQKITARINATYFNENAEELPQALPDEFYKNVFAIFNALYQLNQFMKEQSYTTAFDDLLTNLFDLPYQNDNENIIEKFIKKEIEKKEQVISPSTRDKMSSLLILCVKRVTQALSAVTQQCINADARSYATDKLKEYGKKLYQTITDSIIKRHIIDVGNSQQITKDVKLLNETEYAEINNLRQKLIVAGVDENQLVPLPAVFESSGKPPKKKQQLDSRSSHIPEPVPGPKESLRAPSSGTGILKKTSGPKGRRLPTKKPGAS